MKKRKAKIEDDDSKDNQTNVENNKNEIKKKKFQFSYFFVLVAFSIICFLAVLNNQVIFKLNTNIGNNEFNFNEYPTEIRLLLKRYDRNDDGLLDISEFEPVAERLLHINLTYEYNLPIDNNDEYVTINTNFEPLRLNTLSKDVNNELIGNPETLKFLKEWKFAYKSRQNFGCKHFRSFLPPNSDVKVGDVWYIVKKIEDRFVKHLSNNRYYPPEPTDSELTIYRLLQMFHRRPFLYTRFPPQGITLTLRAKSTKYYDIIFRIHAEFQLNEPPYYPFWFTPGQFSGRLVISKDGSHIEYFKLYLPNEKKLNVDLEWATDSDIDQSIEVDIGYVPHMELTSSGPSNKAFIEEMDSKTGQKMFHMASKQFDKPIQSDLYNYLISEIKWDKDEIKIREAEDILEKTFYPFKKDKILFIS